MSEVYIRSQDKEGLYTIKESCGIRYKEFTNAGMKENRIPARQNKIEGISRYFSP